MAALYTRTILILQEVRELAAVAVPQHLATSRVAQAAAGSRTHLTLTGFSLELLMGFLHSARLSLVLGILNEHVTFQVGRRKFRQELWLQLWLRTPLTPTCFSASLLWPQTFSDSKAWLQRAVRRKAGRPNGRCGRSSLRRH